MKRGFTVLELVIATLIFLMIMGATLTVFFGSNRDYDDLSRDLEVNEKIVRALDRMGEDVREASVVELPPLVPADRTPPPFVYQSAFVSTAVLALINEKPLVNASARGLTSTRERILWYLDHPRLTGLTPGSAPVTTYSMFRSVITTPSPPPQEVISGVIEAVMWRSLRDPNQGPAGAGTGPSVVYVALKIANPRERGDRRVTPGYEVQFQTCFGMRGKDIDTRRQSSGGLQP